MNKDKFFSMLSVEKKLLEKLDLQRLYLPKGIFPKNFGATLGYEKCINKCLFCPQTVNSPDNASWLDLRLLEKMLNEMPEHNILIGFGSYSESLQAPNLISALKLMKRIRPNLIRKIATSGVTANREIIRELIVEGLDWFQFSFDAADRNSYKALMGRDNFEKAEKKLEMILKVRDELKSSMRVGAHIMAFENQIDSYKIFREKWVAKGVEVSFRPVGNWGNAQYGIKKKLKENGFIPVNKIPEKRYPCLPLFMSFCMGTEGDYYPCCIANIPGVQQESKLGHIDRITFKEAWRKMDFYREMHLNGRWDEIKMCRTCDCWASSPNIFSEENNNFSLDQSITDSSCWENVNDFSYPQYDPMQKKLRDHAIPILKALDKMGIKKTALYGAGQHTKRLCSIKESPMSNVKFIVDDNPKVDNINNIPVFNPEKLLEQECQTVIISSDTIENELYKQAKNHFKSNIDIIRLYEP